MYVCVCVTMILTILVTSSITPLRVVPGATCPQLVTPLSTAQNECKLKTCRKQRENVPTFPLE